MLEGWQAEIVSEVRQIIMKPALEVDDSFKWAQPAYEVNGPIAYIKAIKNSVNFGFWRGIDINDPKGLLRGSRKKMRYFKLSRLEDINQQIFSDFVRQAVKLNLTKGDPTRS